MQSKLSYDYGWEAHATFSDYELEMSEYLRQTKFFVSYQAVAGGEQ